MNSLYCPSCGRPGVVVGLDSVLVETRPTVRRHACGVGGAGATVDVIYPPGPTTAGDD